MSYRPPLVVAGVFYHRLESMLGSESAYMEPTNCVDPSFYKYVVRDARFDHTASAVSEATISGTAALSLPLLNPPDIASSDAGYVTHWATRTAHLPHLNARTLRGGAAKFSIQGSPVAAESDAAGPSSSSASWFPRPRLQYDDDATRGVTCLSLHYRTRADEAEDGYRTIGVLISATTKESESSRQASRSAPPSSAAPLSSAEASGGAHRSSSSTMTMCDCAAPTLPPEVTSMDYLLTGNRASIMLTAMAACVSYIEHGLDPVARSDAINTAVDNDPNQGTPLPNGDTRGAQQQRSGHPQAMLERILARLKELLVAVQTVCAVPFTFADSALDHHATCRLRDPPVFASLNSRCLKNPEMRYWRDVARVGAREPKLAGVAHALQVTRTRTTVLLDAPENADRLVAHLCLATLLLPRHAALNSMDPRVVFDADRDFDVLTAIRWSNVYYDGLLLGVVGAPTSLNRVAQLFACPSLPWVVHVGRLAVPIPVAQGRELSSVLSDIVNKCRSQPDGSDAWLKILRDTWHKHIAEVCDVVQLTTEIELQPGFVEMVHPWLTMDDEINLFVAAHLANFEDAASLFKKEGRHPIAKALSALKIARAMNFA